MRCLQALRYALFQLDANIRALTTGTYQRRALLVSAANAELLVKTLFHYRDQGRYQLHGFAVMPEHLHFLLTPALNQTIERCAQCIKGGFSHEVRSQFGGEVRQNGFHDHRFRDGVDFENQLAYIAANGIGSIRRRRSLRRCNRRCPRR